MRAKFDGILDFLDELIKKKNKKLQKIYEEFESNNFSKTCIKTLNIAEASFKTYRSFPTKIKLETCKFNVYHKKMFLTDLTDLTQLNETNIRERYILHKDSCRQFSNVQSFYVFAKNFI